MGFYGGVWGGKRNKCLDVSNNLDQHSDCPIVNLALLIKLRADFDAIFRISLQ